MGGEGGQRTLTTSLLACLKLALSLLTPTPPPSPTLPAAIRLPSFSNSTSSFVLRCRNFLIFVPSGATLIEGEGPARDLPLPPWGWEERAWEDEPGTEMGMGASDMGGPSCEAGTLLAECRKVRFGVEVGLEARRTLTLPNFELRETPDAPLILLDLAASSAS